MTGVEITLNVLAEFIGGSWVEGNALAMNYFKCFGYDMIRSPFSLSLRFDQIAYTSTNIATSLAPTLCGSPTT